MLSTSAVRAHLITLFLIGGGNTLPIYIYTQVKFGITPEVNAIASMLIAASLTISALAFALPSAVRIARRSSARWRPAPTAEASNPVSTEIDRRTMTQRLRIGVVGCG